MQHKAVETLEKLREHMGLPILSVVELLHVSRPAYYRWVAGKDVRESNLRKIKEATITLYRIAQSPEWTSQTADKTLTQKRRREILQNLLAQPSQ